MGTIPYALSIHHFVNSVGSDAGFASIIGLAILVLLYFAQMRETATLRDQATEAAERMRQLEARLTQVLRAQAAATQAAQVQATQRAQPLKQTPAAARIPGAFPAAAPAAAGMLRIAPAGVGAPALTAATKLIPTGGPEGGVAVAPPPETTPRVAPVPFDDLAAPMIAPATAAAGAGNGFGREPGSPARPAGGGAVPPRVQIRPSPNGPAGRRPIGPGRGLEPPEDGPRSGARRLAYGVAGLIVLIAVVVVLLSLTSGGGSSPHASAGKTTNAPTSSTSSHKKAGSGKVTVNPAKVTVGVLNGTATNLLAETVAGKLNAHGFKTPKAMITNALDQTHTTTIVQYLPGTANKDDAYAVQQALDLSRSAVQPVNASTQTIVCPQAGTCTADVIVTVGADLSSSAATSSTTSAGTLTGGTSTTGTSTAG